MIRFLQTPGPMKKIILGGLLLIICAAMVITLVPGGIGSSFGFGAPGRGIVAKVGGEDVTTLEVQREARQMVRQQFPQGGAQASMLLPFFASRAAENLINEKAILAEAEHLGLRASDEEVRDELQHGRYAAAFFPGGTFVGEDRYESMLQEHDLTVPQFEQDVRNEILFAKLQNLVTRSASVTDAEVQQEFEKRNTKVKFQYAVLRQEDIVKDIHPTEAELKAYYERNQATYKNSVPEKRKLQYVLLDTAKVEGQTQVSRDEIQAYYDQHRDEYRVPEQVNVRQILVKTPLPGPDGKVDPKGVDAARAKAEEALKELKGGAKFEDLAKKYSDDPSGKSGGSVGWVRRGGFPVPEVDKAAFSLPKGGTSDVINAGYAFVILHVDDKQDAHAKSLDEVKDQIEPVLKQQKAARANEGKANALLIDARSNGLEKAAAGKGLTVVTADFVSRGDSLPGIGSTSQFMDAVFNEAEKSPPDEAQVPQGFVVFQVTDIKPPATPPFDQIRTRVENEFKNQRAGVLLSQKTRELSDRAKAAHDLQKAAKEMGASVKTSDFVLPDGQVPDIGSMSGPASVAFTLKPGEISGPIDSGTTGAVLSVLEIQQPSPQDLSTKQDEIRDGLLQNKQSELFNLFLSGLREQMQKSGKIKINQDELKNLTKATSGEEGE